MAAASPVLSVFADLGQVVQSQREAIRAVMEARPSEKKQREGRIFEIWRHGELGGL